MKYKLRLLLLCSMFCLLWALPVAAQDSENDGVARAVMITPKAGHEDALVQAITEYHHWVAQFEGHFKYSWYSVLTGKNTGKFVARSSGHNWSDFDQKFDWQKEADEVFERNVSPHIEDLQIHYTTDMPKVSNWPENFEGYTHYSVTDWYVVNGKYGPFRKGLSTIVEALKEGGFPGRFGFLSIESGGYAGQIQVVGANKGWSDFAKDDPSFYKIMSEKLGSEDEFHAFMADWGSTFKQGASWTVSYMPEASDYGDK